MHKGQGGTKNTTQTPQSWLGTGPPVKYGSGRADVRAMEEGIDRDGLLEGETPRC